MNAIIRTTLGRSDRCAVVVAAIVGASVVIGAAPQRGTNLQFADVAIRDTDAASAARPGAGFLPSGDFSGSRQTLRQLIAIAYGVRDYQVVDGPEWLTSARFDVTAKAPDAASAVDGPEMLRRALADRFGLTVHSERRKRNAYVLGRAGRALGRRLRTASARCTPMPGAWEDTSAPAASRGNECRMAWGWNRNTIYIRQSPMSALVGILEVELGDAVVDRTGLAGKYDADVLLPELAPGTPKPRTRAPDDPLLIAVREQLGLRIERTAVDFQALSVTAAHRP
jgi:uncharacterized protein (TIGR03435 family)